MGIVYLYVMSYKIVSKPKWVNKLNSMATLSEKIIFEVFAVSEFQYVCSNLMPLQEEGINYWRISTIQTFKYKKLLLKSPQNTRSCVKCYKYWEKRKAISQNKHL